jgi:LysM repeat protein
VSAQLAGTSSQSGRFSHYLAPVALMVLVAAVIGVVVTIPGGSYSHHRVGTVAHRPIRRLRPYWFVRPGDTLSEVSVKTGLSVEQLEGFNPKVDPNNLLPGERLNLWRHPPVPRPPPPGPMFWTVRPGESYGSIAAKTGINIITLEELNPRLKATSLQPGDRIRLHH